MYDIIVAFLTVQVIARTLSHKVDCGTTVPHSLLIAVLTGINAVEAIHPDHFELARETASVRAIVSKMAPGDLCTPPG